MRSGPGPLHSVLRSVCGTGPGPLHSLLSSRSRPTPQPPTSPGADWDLELAVEARQCPPRSGVRCWEEAEKVGGGRGGGASNSIKSRGPHLAGREKMQEPWFFQGQTEHHKKKNYLSCSGCKCCIVLHWGFASCTRAWKSRKSCPESGQGASQQG